MLLGEVLPEQREGVLVILRCLRILPLGDQRAADAAQALGDVALVITPLLSVDREGAPRQRVCLSRFSLRQPYGRHPVERARDIAVPRTQQTTAQRQRVLAVPL